MIILSIDTSADETSVAITDGLKVLANSIYSQILIHTKWGGVVPSLAKRAHEERIDTVINTCCESFLRYLHIPKGSDVWEIAFSHIDAVAVTCGPGLAIALEVGIRKAEELSSQFGKPLIAMNHLEGHVYSCFVQNRNGKPERQFHFPYLSLLVSGGHTQLILFSGHREYKILGSTLDDAAGEALDKAAKLLGFGYPGGPVLEQLATQVKNVDNYRFPRPMVKANTLDMSFSGLKTSFFYFLKEMDKKEKNAQLKYLASAFQEAVFDTLIQKTEKAIKQAGINQLIVGGGVIANKKLRVLTRRLAKKYKGSILFPPYSYLTGDNAAMIGVAASFHAAEEDFITPSVKIERVPRLELV